MIIEGLPRELNELIDTYTDKRVAVHYTQLWFRCFRVVKATHLWEEGEFFLGRYLVTFHTTVRNHSWPNGLVKGRQIETGLQLILVEAHYRVYLPYTYRRGLGWQNL